MIQQLGGCSWHVIVPATIYHTSALADVSGLAMHSAGNWAGPGQLGPSPLCFVPNKFGPKKTKNFWAVPVQSRKIVS
jgi:hypothetical protein